jgi:FtsH-binding integral membrane protein
MTRSIRAVVAGYLVFAVSAVALFALAGRDAHAAQGWHFMGISILYGMAFAALGGWIAAKLAPRNPTAHAGAIAVIIAVGAAISIPSVPAGVFPWTQVAAIALMAPSALIGGWLQARKRA